MTLPMADPLQQAIAALRAGKLVALPTETVYGLAADACNDRAVQAIYDLKGRPSHNPLIIHVNGLSMTAAYVDITPLAERLAKQFWPGPLTLVLDKRSDCPISPLASGGGETLAVRMPDHPLAQAAIGGVGGGLAAPSANRSGHVSPTRPRHVRAEFPEADLLILDGGATAVGIESTVVDARGDAPIILRPGSITEEMLKEAIYPPLTLPPKGGEAPKAQWGVPKAHSLHIIQNARKLRKNLTDAETFLWSVLRNKQLDGFRFRRQMPVGRYIADFACLEPRLIIELDGGHHEKQKDEERTAFLKAEGFNVLRFWNHEVLENIEGIIEVIRERLHNFNIPLSVQASPSLSPPLGGRRSVATEGGMYTSLSPGLLSSHYAPSIPLRRNVTEVLPDEALLAFGPDPLTGAKTVLNLSISGDLEEAAANLYASLRQLDTPEHRAIAVMPIPETGIGRAINDRLRRASGS